MNIRIILITAPNKEIAEQIATQLVNKRLAACVNIVPGITSIYRWEDKLQNDSEVLMICKTSELRYEELETVVKKLHPYECPEIIALPVTEGIESYLSWVNTETKR